MGAPSPFRYDPSDDFSASRGLSTSRMKIGLARNNRIVPAARSGGMKRRLEIARGFLHTPKILFLDEPTLGLDPQTRNQLWTRVKTVNEQEGTIWILKAL